MAQEQGTNQHNRAMDDRPVVIVTGSSGLLGQPVCRRLASRGYRVFGFDRPGAPQPPQDVDHLQPIDCDLTKDASVRQALDQVAQATGRQLASVVHMAAYYDFSGEDSELYEKVTINGTDRLLGALEPFRLDQFVFTSTMLVHRPCEVGEHIREDDELRAEWPYPESKIATERLIREKYPHVRSVLLRIAGVYTDYGLQPTLVQQIKRIYERDFRSHFFPGDLDTGQSAVHVDDAVEAIVRTVERRNAIPAKTAILIGEPDPPSYEELQDHIGRHLHGREWSTLYVPKAVAKVGASVADALSGGESFIKPFMVNMADDHYALDVSRAKELLDWKPGHSLRDELPLMLEQLKHDPDRWYEQNHLERP